MVAVLEDFLLGYAGKGRFTFGRDAHRHGIGGCEGRAVLRFPCLLCFSEEPSTGSATYTLAPRKFKDVDGNMAQPDRGFKLTLEMLRRKPDSALIWYEDFRDENPLPESYWTTLSGKWEVWREGYENRPYSQLEGSGQLAWKYSGFQELHLRARLAFPANGRGKAGVFCGDVFCCLNYDTQRVELYKGSALLGSYSQTISRTADANLRGNPTMYTIEMRIRGNKVRVYSGAAYTLRFTATLSGFPAAMQGTAPITVPSANCCGLGTHGPMSLMNGSMCGCRTAVLSPSADFPGVTAPGMRNSRCSR